MAQLLIISPLWGMLSAQFFIQTCAFLILFVFALIGLIRGTVPRSNNLAAMTASLSGAATFAFLFFAGSWIVDYLKPYSSLAAIILYWFFAVFSALFILAQLPAKLTNGWRDAVHEDATLRMAYENAKNWQPAKRPPEMTPASYRVVYSDGQIQDTMLTPREIDDWAMQSNKQFEGTVAYRLVRILDANGNTV